MSRVAHKRGSGRRVQPYQWLGAGAVTVGMGVAMVGGAAVAFADTGADSAGSNASASSAGSASTKSDSGAKRVNRAARANTAGSATASDDSASTSTPAHRGRTSAVTEAPAAAPEVEVPVATPATQTEAPAAQPNAAAATVRNSTPAAAAVVIPERASRVTRDSAPVASTSTSDQVPTADDAPATVPTAAPAADVDPAPAAAAPAAADPAPSMESWLPGGSNPGDPIVPGSHVKLALQEIAATQGILTQETWGKGNFLAGIAAIAPQVMLASAQLVLQAWQATNPGVQSFLANVSNIPILHQIAQAAVVNEMLLPTLSDISMASAALLIPTLKWVGADVTAAQATLSAARQDGKVYAVVPITTKLGTEPMVGVKVNGGKKASLLVDTGASGLVTTRDKIGSGDLGEPIGSGNSCFSGGLCYHYETYNTKVDLGNGASTIAPVNVVTNNDEYPDSVANFKQFFSWGADGILGVGANTAGPGPSPIVTAAMPGSLSDGTLLLQNMFLGLGFMVLGPNPLPTKVSLPGAPDSYVQVSVNGGPKTNAGAIIDSGGVYGTLPVANAGGLAPAGSNLPAGTKISVYTADGSTLLYTYTTKGGDSATPVIASGLMNTGNAPFAKGPIYMNYGYPGDPESPNYGIGSTDFSIW